MKKFLSGLLIAATLIFIGQSFAFAAEQPKGIPAGGKGTTEVAAIEDMKSSTIKRVLAQITSRSDDPASPYQQLLARYKEFIDSVKVEKKGNNSSGAFVTGRVVIKYKELQAELEKIVSAAHNNDEGKKVYIFIRFVGGNSETQMREAEKNILSRYKTRLESNGFNVMTDDETNSKLSQTRQMSFEKFIAWVQAQFEEDFADHTIIVGEIKMAQLDKDDEGYTASCDINIRAFDRKENFKLIGDYEGSDVLRMKDLNRIGQYVLEKAAVTSSKEITDKLVTYWQKR